MSAVLNDRDAILQAATVRIVNPKNAWINLLPSAPGFHLNSAGQADLAVVPVTAELFGLDEAVTFTAVGGTLSNAVGRSVDVTYGGQAAVVTAKVLSNGDEFKRSLVIPVLRDGAAGVGTPGARGAGHYYATGSTWSDVVAQAACPGSTPVLNDVVTISSSTYVMEKRWTGSAWVENGVVVNGKLIAPDSILTSALAANAVTAEKIAAKAVTADKINSRGLNIEALDGTVVLRADASLAQQAASNPNLVPNCLGWPSWEGGANAARNGDARFGDGQFFFLPTRTDSNFVGVQSPAMGIPADADYTVSFDAYCSGAARSLFVDVVYGSTVGIPGMTANLTNTMTRFSFKAKGTTHADMPKAFLRMYMTSPGGSPIIIANVKVELGQKVTPWCDNVVTPANASTFILAAAIKLAMIDKASIGNLQALAAYLGNVEIGPGGSLRQGMVDFLIGKGFFIGERNGVPVLAIGDPQGTGACFYWDGANLVQVGAKQVTTFRVSLPSLMVGQQTQTSTYRDYGNIIPEFSNGPAPYRLVWSLNPSANLLLTVAPDGGSVNIRAKGLNGQLVTGSISLTAYDANNAPASAYSPIEIGFGSNPVPT